MGYFWRIFKIMHEKNQSRAFERLIWQHYREQARRKYLKAERPVTAATAQA